MSAEYRVRIDQLRSEAARTPEGALQIELLEEAVEIADVHQDVDLGYESRMELIGAASWGGAPERMLVAFSWCLAQFDRSPERFERSSLYWRYKWVLGFLPEWPRVPLSRIEAAWQDAERRYREQGISLRPIHQLRASALLAMGRLHEAESAYRMWLDAPRDGDADCAACELSSRSEYLIVARRDEEALTLAAPLLAGRLRCKEEPGRTYSRILLAYLRLGRAAEGIPFYLKAARFAGRNPRFGWATGHFLDFLAYTNNLTRGLRLLEGRFRIAIATVNPADRFKFLLGLRNFLDRLGETRQKPLKLRLSESFPLYRPDAAYPLAELLAWCDREVADLARQFDARNGTDAFARAAIAHRELRKYAADIPITAKS